MIMFGTRHLILLDRLSAYLRIFEYLTPSYRTSRNGRLATSGMAFKKDPDLSARAPYHFAVGVP